MVAQIDKTYLRRRPGRLWPRLLAYTFFEGRPLTTRGRWVNPLVFGLFRLWRALPQLRGVVAPIFILSTGRSGTTILGLQLSMHRDVGFLNEPKAVWGSLHKGEDLIGSYHQTPARYRMGVEDVTDGLRQGLQRIYGAYLRLSGTKRVADKYPELIFRMPFVLSLFPDAKCLFLARNGWDTCASVAHWSKNLGVQERGEVHDWWGLNSRKWHLLVEQLVPEHPDLAPHAEEMHSWTRHEDRAALEWIVTMREGLAAVDAFPRSVLWVSYEEMCARPRVWMERIAGFCGLSPDPVFLDYAEDVLLSAPTKPSCALHPCLHTPFSETMTLLGYTKDTQ